MKSVFKDAILITIAIASFVVLIAGVFQLASFLHHDDPEEILSFVIAAKTYHEKIEVTNLLESIEILLTVIPGESVENTSEIENMIREGMLSARLYRENYSWLPPTEDTLWIYTLLVKESTMIVNCYSDLNFAWLAKRSEDYISCDEYCDEARKWYEEVKDLRLQNTDDLENLQLKVELEINESKN